MFSARRPAKPAAACSCQLCGEISLPRPTPQRRGRHALLSQRISNRSSIHSIARRSAARRTTVISVSNDMQIQKCVMYCSVIVTKGVAVLTSSIYDCGAASGWKCRIVFGSATCKARGSTLPLKLRCLNLTFRHKIHASLGVPLDTGLLFLVLFLFCS